MEQRDYMWIERETGVEAIVATWKRVIVKVSVVAGEEHPQQSP